MNKNLPTPPALGQPPESLENVSKKSRESGKIRKLEKAVAVRNSLLERFSGKFRRCWKMIPRLSGSAKSYPCQGLGTFFLQGKRLLENWPRLRERCWIFSTETATAFLSSSEKRTGKSQHKIPKGFARVFQELQEALFRLCWGSRPRVGVTQSQSHEPVLSAFSASLLRPMFL